MSLWKASNKKISSPEEEYVTMIMLIKAIKAHFCFLNENGDLALSIFLFGEAAAALQALR